MAIRGSGAIYDACDSVLIFSAQKGEPVTVKHDKARVTGRTHDDFRLWIEDVEIDGIPDAGLRVSCLDAPTRTTTEPETPDRFAQLQARVLGLIRQQGTVTGGANVIRARVKARKDDVTAALKELERTGRIRKGGTYHEPTYTAAGTDHDA